MKLYLPNREHGFTHLINEMGLKTGIEIGVRTGEYSQYLLQNTNLDVLYSLDLFPYPNMLPMTAHKLNPFGERSKIIQASTPEYAVNFADDFFDFIYIDANHTYEAVKKDLITWWPKLKRGGLFCGDDYTELVNPGEGKYGVVQAVNEFVQEYDQDLYVTGAGNNTPQELNRIATVYGKIIEAILLQKLDVKVGTTYEDDLKIPNWYMIKH
jgi:predicted O-methyltransferase YrrM